MTENKPNRMFTHTKYLLKPISTDYNRFVFNNSFELKGSNILLIRNRILCTKNNCNTYHSTSKIITFHYPFLFLLRNKRGEKRGIYEDNTPHLFLLE